jgi:uncharacterized membrane protein
MKSLAAIPLTIQGRGAVWLLIGAFVATTAVAAANTLQVESEFKEPGVAPSGPAYWTINFGNKCSVDDVFVAVRYRDTQGQWVTEGWWNIPYKSRVRLAQAKSSTIFFYAEDTRGRHSVGSKNLYKVTATRSRFKYSDDGGAQPEKAVDFLEQNIRRIDTLWFTCD